VRGDFTRFTYAADKHYTAVRQQQGRVTVDADGNELQDILEHLRTTTTADVVGDTGAPSSAPGFAVSAAGATLSVGPGRYYVGGVLCESDATVPLDNQPDLRAGSPFVRLPDGTESATAGAGTYVVYLDVWSRLLTALDDDTIRERALGGPDTTTRVKTVWQAKLLRVGGAGAAVTCGTSLPAWDALSTPPTGTLAVRAQVDDDAPRPCDVPAGAGYRRLENQLYRVEIHKGGPTGTATFVWSRDNGSVERRWETTTGSDLTLSSPSGDPSAALPSGSWVELTDDSHELTGHPGTLVRVVRPRGTVLEVNPATATGSMATADFPLNRRARRWDSDGEQLVRVPAANGGWIALEDGVEVHFAPGATYRTGDYWTVPARTATTDVEWPKAAAQPAQVPPHGVRHRLAKLAVASFDGATWTLLDDCRIVFPPLTGLLELFYLSGDGQEALPDPGGARVPLAQPLKVGVSRGSTPARNVRVQFGVAAGTGQVAGAATTTVVTGADGTASVAWSLDSTTTSQQVTARLLSPSDMPVHLPITFTGRLSIAAQVGYDPAACVELAGAATVQQAIDRLCTIHDGGCATVVVTPDDRWWEVVESLPDGQDAHVCFTTGRFEIERELRILGKGHVLLHGAGRGTRIVAAKSETAVLVADCASFTAHDLAVEAGLVQRTGDHVNGALTVSGTAGVSVERLDLTCATGPRRGAACLVVRARMSDRGDLQGALDLVRVRDCRFTVGHLQSGLLVLNARRIDVTDNDLAVASDGRGISLVDILADRVRRAMLAKQLVARAVVPSAAVAGPAAGANTTLAAGRWLVRFPSPVAGAEWERLAADHPPENDELASATGMTRYARRLADLAVEQPSRLAGFERQLGGLRNRLGGRFGDLTGGATGPDVLRDLLIPGDVQVVAARREPVRTTRVALGGTPLHFDSVVASSDTWSRAIEAAGLAQDANPRRAMRTLTARIIGDAAFRDRFPSFTRWWSTLERAGTAAMAQGIVVGGTQADMVDIRRNTVASAVEGVRVALSHRTVRAREAYDSAGTVAVEGNQVSITVPAEQTDARVGIYVGNAHSVLVADNTVSGPQGQQPVVREGVHVWGHFGPMAQVRSNLVERTMTGITLMPYDASAAGVWLVADNVTRGGSTTVVAGPGVSQRGNAS
jgi:hypothetical protein